MALEITVPDQVEVGDLLTITGSGATASGNVSLSVSAEESDGGLEVEYVLAADGSGNFDLAGVLMLRANTDGHVDIKAVDATSSDVAMGRTEVLRSE